MDDKIANKLIYEFQNLMHIFLLFFLFLKFHRSFACETSFVDSLNGKHAKYVLASNPKCIHHNSMENRPISHSILWCTKHKGKNVSNVFLVFILMTRWVWCQNGDSFHSNFRTIWKKIKNVQEIDAYICCKSEQKDGAQKKKWQYAMNCIIFWYDHSDEIGNILPSETEKNNNNDFICNNNLNKK